MADVRSPGRTEMSLSRIEQLCHEHGLRMTSPRRIIARILSDAADHPDVDEVYRRAHALDPRIALSTVYRTLKLFEIKGILARHDFGAGRVRYEPSSHDHHDHLINIDTGAVVEFQSADIERLQVRIARELGFELVGHRLQLFGRPLTRPPRKSKKT